MCYQRTATIYRLEISLRRKTSEYTALGTETFKLIKVDFGILKPRVPLLSDNEFVENANASVTNYFAVTITELL